MLAKVAAFKNNLEWVERMDVTVNRDNQDTETGPESEGTAADNDFEREILLCVAVFVFLLNVSRNVQSDQTGQKNYGTKRKR